MTVKLNLKPEVEASLVARARAKGVALDAYLLGVIEELALAGRTPRASVADFRAALEALAQGAESLPLLAPEAFSRESIYRNGG